MNLSINTNPTNTKMSDNQKYIKGLLNNDSEVLRTIYVNYADRIKQHILKNGGTADDAKDVFQDALIVIYNKARNEDFELTSQFYTYLFGICHFIFDRKRKKKSNNSVTTDDFDGYISEHNFEQDIFTQEKYKIYQEHFLKLGVFCQKILEHFFAKKSMEEIAAILNLENAHTARNRKYRCQKELEKMIRADVRYSELQKNK